MQVQRSLFFQKEKHACKRNVLLASNEARKGKKILPSALIKMIKITYLVHGTTEDNKKHLASGHVDVELSELDVEQGKLLDALRKEKFDVVFSSDLKRAVDNTKLSFEGRYKLIQDKRLRECNH